MWCDANVFIDWKGEDVPAVRVVGERTVATSIYAFAVEYQTMFLRSIPDSFHWQVPSERALITMTTQILKNVTTGKLLEIGAGKVYCFRENARLNSNSLYV